jgi:hypothetical protein
MYGRVGRDPSAAACRPRWIGKIEGQERRASSRPQLTYCAGAAYSRWTKLGSRASPASSCSIALTTGPIAPGAKREKTNTKPAANHFRIGALVVR